MSTGTSSTGTSQAPQAPLLAGLSVLELGDGVAGASAGAMLAALGAAVTTVTDPLAPYRRSHPWFPPGADQGTGLLGLLLAADKKCVQLGQPALAGLDAAVGAWQAQATAARQVRAVIVDRVGGSPYGIAELADVGGYLRWAQASVPGALVTVSAFGLSGPRRNDRATELTIGAASGMLASARDRSTDHPLKLAGWQALLSAGQAVTLAVCHAVDLAGREAPAHLDLSAQEAAIAMGPMLLAAKPLLAIVGPTGAGRYGGPSGTYPCADGEIAISVMEDHQWRGAVTAMGAPDWTREFATTRARLARKEVVDGHVRAWTKDFGKVELEALLQSSGVPATAVLSPSDLLASAQLRYRQALRRVELPGGRAADLVGLPFKPVPPARPSEPPRRRSLRGLRVLEAGHVLAIPLAGAILGALGADVTKLEDLSHIDMYRRRAPFIAGEEGINRAAYFAMANHSKKNLVTDLDRSTEDLDAVLGDLDVVIENFGRRRADRLGISAYALMSASRPVLAVSSSGFGFDGPSASYRAYAYNVHTTCGLTYLTRNADGETAQIDMPVADLVSGYAVATIVAAWAVGPRGNGPVGVDLSMAELIARRFNEFLAAASLAPAAEDGFDRANEQFPYAPSGIYPARDGWIAVSVTSDESFAGIRHALGDPDSLADEGYRTARGRFDRRAELDAALAAELRDRTPAEARAIIGADSEIVVHPLRLVDDPQLVERDFFATVSHPEWGARRVIGIPWRPVGTGPIALGSPPSMDPATVAART